MTDAKRLLITGSSGFIARHLIPRVLERGYEVLGIDRREPVVSAPGFTHVTCDIMDYPAFLAASAAFRPELVIHLAARIDVDPTATAEDYPQNIGGVRNMARVIREVGSVQRAICTSTQLVCKLGYVPQNDLDFAPNTAYGESKVRTEQIWREEDGGGVEWCMVRPTTIWGPHMNPGYLPFLRMVRDGRYFHVGHEPLRKSYGYVGNTVAQYIALLEAPADRIHGRVFYLADYEPTDLRDWAEAFRAGLNAPKIRTLDPRAAKLGARIGDIVTAVGWRRFPFTSYRLNNVLTRYVFDLTDTEAVCGPLPYSMEEGVEETVHWLREIWQKPVAAG
jgi:GlcNAc-P-P-Und epimerase